MLNKKRFRLKQISKNKSFLEKLYDMLNNEDNKKIIYWNNEGTAIIIVNINKLCECVLPKYYKHANYSSFVRQLNIYGFYKAKGIQKEGESFEHHKLNKNSTKEEILEITQNKRIKNQSNQSNYNINNILYNSNNINNMSNLSNTATSIDNNYTIDFLLKVSIIENKIYGHNIFLRKFLNKNSQLIREIDTKSKCKSLKDFFKKYLYYLKIYSPYVALTGNRTEKVYSFNIGNINRNKNKIEIYNNCHINNINF